MASSQVLHFQGDYVGAIELKERAFAAYRRRGKRVEAAELARWLAFLHVSVHGNVAAANGWMARAESLLEGVRGVCCARLADPRPCAVRRAPSASGSPQRRSRSPGGSVTRALEFDALALLGEAYVASGRVAEGMTLLDRGDGRRLGRARSPAHGAVGEIYCRLLSACEHAADVRRAEQWMALVDRFVVWRRLRAARPAARTTAGS